ncbi:helix-turn-helix domain-containing protein [Thomasclavelia spiroformis]|nr:helix-turn-helix domain-containing protein [Thomasclavelia spiroformis]
MSQVLLSNQTIRKLIKEGRLHATKLGHVYRIPKTSLIQLKMNS